MNQPIFSQTDHAMSRTCRVEIDIRAGVGVAWALLTDASDFPRWNSTVTRVEGRIADGERLRLYVPGTTHVFTPRISGMAPMRRMVWSDGVAGLFRGARIFTLEPRGAELTRFVMKEKFAGIVFALIKAKMPDFRPIFEAFASDLAIAAERPGIAGPRSPI